MSRLLINGGNELRGSLAVQGAKNSALPVLAAAVLAQGVSEIHRCPDLLDVAATLKILKHLGCKISAQDGVVTVDSTVITGYSAPDELMREMRSSVIFLGAILARTGRAVLSYPGGCELGPRPIDIHLSALRQLGAVVREEHGYLDCRVDGRLRGSKITLSFPSVGATENVMLAAATAQGRTVIEHAAREPEITDLAEYLNNCGAKIRGAGGGTIVIDGVERLHGACHTVIPDRIVAATYMAAAAVTHGKIELRGVEPEHLGAVIPMFEEMGCGIEIKDDKLKFTSPQRLRRVKLIRTMPYPGFPTDLQAPFMAATTIARGTSMFIENIFSGRYKHIGELIRLGANIKAEERVAVVEGVPTLTAAAVESTDLRGGAALVIAGLAANGQTEVGGVHHIDRGYESIEKSLTALGADIKRV